MELRNYSRLLLFACVVACIASSCVKEGPAGPAGTNGTNGTNGADGQITCLNCHAGTTMDQKKAEFAMSEHAVGAVAVAYAGGNASCARCHSSQGFIEFATLGSVAGTITNPSAWECATCHGIHSTFEATDYALRQPDPTKVLAAIANGPMDLSSATDKNSNFCANCHQSRTAEPNVVTPGAATVKLNAHFGPHHGPQANVVYGNGFAEIPGSVSYPAKGSSKHLAQASCVGCHMATFSSGQGGHSLIPSLDACNKCHNATDKSYDHDGIQTDTQAKLDQLRDKLVQLGVIIHDTVANTYAPAVITVPMVQAQAAFNYFGLTDDRSEGVHNPPYVRALLMNTIEALNK
jgi:hypothetical protein